jgi:hypothetical protein
MENEINIDIFKEVIKKSTLNLSIAATRIKFKDGRLYSGMHSDARDISVVLDWADQKLVDLTANDELEFNLSDLQKPLATFDGIKKYTSQHIMNTNIFDGPDNPRIILKPTFSLEGQTANQKIRVAMVAEAVTEPWILQSRQKADIPYYVVIDDLTPDHMKVLYQTKDRASGYGKVYIKVVDGKLYTDATDENNMYEHANLIPLTLQDINIENDVVSCYEFAHFSNLLDIITEEMAKENGKKFSMGFSYDENTETGVLHVFDPEKTEQYFLFTRPI